MGDQLDNLLKGNGGGGNAIPTILFKGAYVSNKIDGLLTAYCKMFPQEVEAIGRNCKFLRDNAEWKGQFSRVIYNAKDGLMAIEAKVPLRLAQAMNLLFHPNWMDDKEIFDPFMKKWSVIGAIRQLPKPDITRHLSK